MIFCNLQLAIYTVCASIQVIIFNNMNNTPCDIQTDSKVHDELGFMVLIVFPVLCQPEHYCQSNLVIQHF